MTIAFTEIPANLRVPGTYVEFDPSLAERGVGSFPLRGLIIGQKQGGTLAALAVERITSPEQASALAGPGSIGSRMAAAWFQVNQATEVDLILLAAAGGATPAIKTITFGGGSAPGGLAVYIGGDRYFIDTSGATTATAAALVGAIDENPETPMVATINPGNLSQVILTARCAGEAGNQIDVRVAHLDGESIPSGLTVTIATSAAGAGNPTIATALSAVSDVHYDIIAHPFTDTTNLAALEADLAARETALRAQQGHAFTGFIGSQGVLAAMGDARNSRNSTIVGLEPFPGVSYERAAQVAALVAFHGSIDPVRPFQTLELSGYAPAVEDRFSVTERNLLLADGISTTVADRVGQVRIERLITTYQTNAAGAPSIAYLDVNTRLAQSFYRKAVTARVALRFPRHKLADDSANFTPGPSAKIVTPKVFMAELVGHYQELVNLGICEDLDGFVANSIVERDPGDPNRLNAALAPNFVNGLIVSAVLVQFRL